jgi:hypothetical protein
MCGSRLESGAKLRDLRATTNKRQPPATPGDSLVLDCGLVWV